MSSRAISIGFDRQPRTPPFGKSTFKSSGFKARFAQPRYRFERQDTPRPTTVSNDILVARQLGKAFLEFVEWEPKRPFEVRFGENLQIFYRIEHAIIYEAILDVFAVAFCLYQACGFQLLQVFRGIGY